MVDLRSEPSNAKLPVRSSEVTRFLFKGGLGDILLGLHHADCYERLESIEDFVQIRIVSHCRGVKELFDHHPKRHLFKIEDLPYTNPFDETGYVLPTSHCWRSSLTLYPSARDLGILSTLGKRTVVFALSSSNDTRTIPLEVAERAAELALKQGFTICAVGKTYEAWHNWDGRLWNSPRHEPILKERAGVVNLVDQLSLPGVGVLVRNSAWTLCSYSAIMLWSWLLEIPCFAIMPDLIWAGEYQRLQAFNIAGHTFQLAGACAFGEWGNGEALERFVARKR